MDGIYDDVNLFALLILYTGISSMLTPTPTVGDALFLPLGPITDHPQQAACLRMHTPLLLRPSITSLENLCLTRVTIRICKIKISIRIGIIPSQRVTHRYLTRSTINERA